MFRGNQGTPIRGLSTTVTSYGAVLFEDNVAFEGGAISLSLSMLRFAWINGTQTIITVANNTATNTGGGIYVESSLSTDPYTGSDCFYEIKGLPLSNVLSINWPKYLIIVFTNNTAVNGGDDV